MRCDCLNMFSVHWYRRYINYFKYISAFMAERAGHKKAVMESIDDESKIQSLGGSI